MILLVSYSVSYGKIYYSQTSTGKIWAEDAKGTPSNRSHSGGVGS